MIEALHPAEPIFVPARWFTRVGRKRVDWIVIHDMEVPEGQKTALTVAARFAVPTAKEASCHYCVDATTVVQCVRDEDVAWHAPGANRNGIGIEHAGYASQTPEQWTDDYSTRMLARSAELVRRLCARWSIPIVRLSAEDLLAGKRGICGHGDVTKAWPVGPDGTRRTHTDPGPTFPWLSYMGMLLVPPTTLIG